MTDFETRQLVVDGVRSTVLLGGDGISGEGSGPEPLRAADLDALVVFGDADVYIPAVLAERQRRPFPRVRIQILPGVGHWAWLEQPDRVAEFVVPFLREHVGRDSQQPATTRRFT